MTVAPCGYVQVPTTPPYPTSLQVEPAGHCDGLAVKSHARMQFVATALPLSANAHCGNAEAGGSSGGQSAVVTQLAEQRSPATPGNGTGTSSAKHPSAGSPEGAPSSPAEDSPASPNSPVPGPLVLEELLSGSGSGALSLVPSELAVSTLPLLVPLVALLSPAQIPIGHTLNALTGVVDARGLQRFSRAGKTLFAL